MKKLSFFLVIITILMGVTGCSEVPIEIAEIHVIFDTQGGSEVQAVVVDGIEDILTFETPSREGYVFEGWYLDPEGTKELNEENLEIVSDSITLYAKWSEEITKYTIVWIVFEQGYLVTEEITKGDKIELPLMNEVEGHTFDKWYIDDFITVFDADIMPDQNLIIYGRYLPNTYTLSFNSDGGSNIDSRTLTYGDSLGTIEVPSKEGYTFLGWDQQIPATMPASNLELTALWEINTYSIYFEENEGSTVDDQEYLFNQEILGLPETIREGYEFLGWFDGETYFELNQLMPARDITLTARWQIKGYTLTFISEVAQPDPIVYEYMETINLPTLSLDGYTFLGWFLDASYTQPVIIEYMPDEDLSIYAKWLTKQYVIELNPNGGTLLGDQEINVNMNGFIPNIEIPTRVGYTFLGWFEDDELFDMDQKMPSNNIQLEAKWLVNQYTITYDTDGGNEIGSFDYDFGQTIDIPPIPVKEDYTFMGWEPSIPTVMPAENLVLKAQWVLTTYTISFDTNGGSNITSIVDLPGTAVSAPADPTRERFIFIGWFMDEELLEPYEFTIMPKENITIYAKWEQTLYRITFIANGGNLMNSLYLDFESGESITGVEDPTRTGYTFTGWFESDVSFDVTQTMPERDIVLDAKWEVNSYTITFDTDGGSLIDAQTYNFAQNIVVPNEPTKSGYTFLGWSPSIPQTMPAENITVQAQWGTVIINEWSFSIISETSSSITVEIIIGEEVDFAGFEMLLYYDSNHLEIESIGNNLGSTINSTTVGQIKVVYVDAVNPITSETSVMTVTFNRITAETNYGLSIQVDDMITVNESYDPIPVSYVIAS